MFYLFLVQVAQSQIPAEHAVPIAQFLAWALAGLMALGNVVGWRMWTSHLRRMEKAEDDIADIRNDFNDFKVTYEQRHGDIRALDTKLAEAKADIIKEIARSQKEMSDIFVTRVECRYVQEKHEIG